VSVEELVVRISAKFDRGIDRQLDDLVCGCYGFAHSELNKLFGVIK
jgi:hypothetical protein